MDLQELISRGRFLFSRAPARLQVFERVNGKRTAKEIAKALRREITNIMRDLATLRDAGLIETRRGTSSEGPVRKDGGVVYQKLALAKTIPLRYFQQATARPAVEKGTRARGAQQRTVRTRASILPVPPETEILDITKNGEDQTHEFKASSTDVRKIVREIAAMANTSRGGLILYGVADDGTIEGAAQSRQKFDQPLQNSVRSSIAPALTVRVHSVSVLGSTILVIVVPPWNRRDVYHFDDRVLIRKGTNVFAARPEESRKLHRAKVIV